MSAEATTTYRTGADDRSVYWIGGVSAILLGVGYVMIFPLYAGVGAPPSGGEAWFAYLPGKAKIWWAIVGLSVFTDLLFLPIAFALYVALKSVNRSAMLVAAALMCVFVVVDLAVTWTNYASLLKLSEWHAAATSDAQRAMYLAAASYASAVLASRLEIVYAIVVLSSAILIAGVVMLQGAFGRMTAFLAMTTGVLGIVSLAGWGVTIILNALFATAWLFLLGVRFCRLARR
jgi:hypothetical protein